VRARACPRRYMGIMIITITALLFFVYFPEHGSMLFPAGGLGKYDPQVIKAPSDYRGADSMDYEAARREAARLGSTTIKGAGARTVAIGDRAEVGSASTTTATNAA